METADSDLILSLYMIFYVVAIICVSWTMVSFVSSIGTYLPLSIYAYAITSVVGSWLALTDGTCNAGRLSYLKNDELFGALILGGFALRYVFNSYYQFGENIGSKKVNFFDKCVILYSIIVGFPILFSGIFSLDTSKIRMEFNWHAFHRFRDNLTNLQWIKTGNFSAHFSAHFLDYCFETESKWTSFILLVPAIAGWSKMWQSNGTAAYLWYLVDFIGDRMSNSLTLHQPRVLTAVFRTAYPTCSFRFDLAVSMIRVFLLIPFFIGFWRVRTNEGENKGKVILEDELEKTRNEIERLKECLRGR
jgi:hypothetical protein